MSTRRLNSLKGGDPANVRFGSLADILRCGSHVRFSPDTGHYRKAKCHSYSEPMLLFCNRRLLHSLRFAESLHSVIWHHGVPSIIGGPPDTGARDRDVLQHHVSAPAAARSRNQVTPAIGRRRAAGRQLSPSRSLLKIALFPSPATRKAACRLLSSAG